VTNGSTFFACFAGLTFFACSSTSDGTPVGQAPGDASTPATDGEGSPPQDSGTGVKDAAGSDTGSLPDGGGATDGNTTSLAPRPPSGATKCGSGTFSANDSTTACQSQPTFGGQLAYPHDCGSVDVAGGQFEVWCSSTETYLWARFDGVGVKSPYECNVTVDGSVYPYYPELSIGSGEVEIHAGASGIGTGATPYGNGLYLTYGTPGTFAIDVTTPGAFSSGTATIWVVTQQNNCPGSQDLPKTITAGVPLTW
jgi:hypothetical protein